MALVFLLLADYRNEK